MSQVIVCLRVFSCCSLPAAPADVLQAAGGAAAAEGGADLQGREDTSAGAGAQQPEERQPQQCLTSAPPRPGTAASAAPTSDL